MYLSKVQKLKILLCQLCDCLNSAKKKKIYSMCMVSRVITDPYSKKNVKIFSLALRW